MRRSRTKEELLDTPGDFGRFTEIMKQLVAVPHGEVKAAMEADKQARKSSSSAFRVPDASSKRD